MTQKCAECTDAEKEPKLSDEDKKKVCCAVCGGMVDYVGDDLSQVLFVPVGVQLREALETSRDNTSRALKRVLQLEQEKNIMYPALFNTHCNLGSRKNSHVGSSLCP